MKKLASIVLMTGIFFSAFAEKFSEKEKNFFNQKFNPVIQEFEKGKMDGLIELMPPEIFAYFAKQANIDVLEFKKQMKQMTNRMLVNTEFIKYVYDIDSAEVEKSTARRYSFVPTENSFIQSNETTTVKGHLLLIEDEGDWYVLNWQNHLAPVLYAVYPDLKDIKPLE